VRQLTFAQAIHEAVDLAMELDPAVYTMGLGVPDPRGIFGTLWGFTKSMARIAPSTLLHRKMP
jgi:pyruvate dehydrogenase E1 component beta subunit